LDSATATTVASKQPEEEEANIISTLQSMQEYMCYLPAYDLHRIPCTLTTWQEKQTLLQQLASQCFLTRNSEGKVVYFLTKQGQVKKLMKYKTWWYIYRRSIREITSKLFNRFTQALAGNEKEKGKGKEKEVVAATMTKEMQELQRLTKQYENMGKAKPPYTPAFQSKLDGVMKSIEAVKAKIAQEQANQSNRELVLTKAMQDIHEEIRTKWIRKFSFLEQELNADDNSYEAGVSQIMEYAHGFVDYVVMRLVTEWNEQQQSQAEGVEGEEEASFMKIFRKYYPKIWEEFLVYQNISTDI